MKKLFFLIALLSYGTSWSASAADVKNKASETVDAASDYTKEQKDAFVKEMDKNLISLKAKISKIKQQAGQSKDNTVSKLESDQLALEHDIAQMKKSSGKAWGKLKTGVSKAWSEISASLSEAKAELKK